MKFEIYRTKNKQFGWRMRASNGQIIAQSEGYTRRRNALKTIRGIQVDARNAPIYGLNIQPAVRARRGVVIRDGDDPGGQASIFLNNKTSNSKLTLKAIKNAYNRMREVQPSKKKTIKRPITTRAEAEQLSLRLSQYRGVPTRIPEVYGNDFTVTETVKRKARK